MLPESVSGLTGLSVTLEAKVSVPLIVPDVVAVVMGPPEETPVPLIVRLFARLTLLTNSSAPPLAIKTPAAPPPSPEALFSATYPWLINTLPVNAALKSVAPPPRKSVPAPILVRSPEP